jgi:hypothetical protein
LTWAHATSGVPATCQSCGRREILLGHADLGRDPQGLAVFRESARGRTVLTFRCAQCGILNAVDIGETAHSPPASFPGLPMLLSSKKGARFR